ncbi:iron-containing alcohol dehydrogenase [Paraburkholderia sp. BL9I2N2]|uniref:iron-containing alcohol dehydrogenase n=1 Tax=Paraburkholderia sp. BL9I2N2 TaxID=1938809 RepID=UPI00104F3361|nr:iron-containing alcohol dehydrogenase [Paraburkholderia sp. BL9I2N2]TCK84156.1 alcohol dehydrogenase class IV [Paraburkholderia sp. BL9I2N2]
MNSFEFQSTRSTIVEPGASARLGEIAQRLGCRRIFLVTDKGILDNGLLESAVKSFATAGIAVTVCSDVQADPPAQVILAATAAAVEANADGVIGLGGGSSMDVAKLVALLATGNEKLDEIYGVGVAKGPRLPLILVPTTAGTGSEVTPISIVTTGEGEKKGVVSPVLLPDIAVLDADLTLGLPSSVTAATGIDAMVHAIEAYTSKRLKNPVSDCLAREALRLLGSNIHEACSNGSNRDARQGMLLGAMLAGLAFANAPVAGVHALAYPIGARFHVPHGLSNSLVLPAVMRFNLEAAEGLYAEIAPALIPNVQGTESQKARSLVERLAALPTELSLPTRLRDVGIAAGDIQALAEDAMRQTRLLVNNPKEILLGDARAIYEEVL